LIQRSGASPVRTNRTAAPTFCFPHLPTQNRYALLLEMPVSFAFPAHPAPPPFPRMAGFRPWNLTRLLRLILVKGRRCAWRPPFSRFRQHDSSNIMV